VVLDVWLARARWSVKLMKEEYKMLTREEIHILRSAEDLIINDYDEDGFNAPWHLFDEGWVVWKR